MKIVNKVELKLQNYDKCQMVCDSDCPMGQLYDYSCSLQVFVLEKMNAAKEAQKVKEEPKVEVKE